MKFYSYSGIDGIGSIECTLSCYTQSSLLFVSFTMEAGFFDGENSCISVAKGFNSVLLFTARVRKSATSLSNSSDFCSYLATNIYKVCYCGFSSCGFIGDYPLDYFPEVSVFVNHLSAIICLSSADVHGN